MNSGPTIGIGATGDDVHRLQVLLVEMKLLDFTGIDSDFGPITQARVEGFQSSNGLVADGIVGPLTWGALPADPNTPQLASGANGSEVVALQQGLTTVRGARSESGTDRRRVRSDDRRRGARYQGDRGVGVDGIVGDQTWWVPAGGAGATLASLSGLTTV